MKKLCIVLLLAAIGKTLSAQIYYYDNPPSSSVAIFTSPEPGSVYNRFEFVLPQNNRMIIEMNTIHHLELIPDLDSLFQKIWLDLKPIYDSLTDPIMVRRIDYVASATGDQVRIRLKQHQPGSTYFSYKDDELIQLKVDQDTLRFKGYIEPVDKSGRRSYTSGYYSVMLLLNNISDVSKFPEDLLGSGVRLLRKDLGGAFKKSARVAEEDIFYYATYDVQKQKRVAPSKINRIGFGRRYGFTPYIQASFQYGRGEWIPAAGLGVEFYYNASRHSKIAIRAYWEPYFFFSRDADKKLVTDRNDFITFRFQGSYRSSTSSRTFEFNQSFSVGILVNRNGEWFEKKTSKFSFPGLQIKNVLLEPEFFFSKGFKSFSPSLKLLINLE